MPDLAHIAPALCRRGTTSNPAMPRTVNAAPARKVPSGPITSLAIALPGGDCFKHPLDVPRRITASIRTGASDRLHQSCGTPLVTTRPCSRRCCVGNSITLATADVGSGAVLDSTCSASLLYANYCPTCCAAEATSGPWTAAGLRPGRRRGVQGAADLLDRSALGFDRHEPKDERGLPIPECQIKQCWKDGVERRLGADVVGRADDQG
jgi:hypothetical protein